MNSLNNIKADVTSALNTVAERAEFENWDWGTGIWTIALKNELARLARKYGYDVCAAGAESVKYGEWLYDLCWYSMTKNGGDSYLQRIVLAAELEWKPEPSGDGDFEKLIQARCHHRLWIFGTKTQADIESMFKVCKRQIAEFEGSQNGDHYLLAGIANLPSNRRYVVEEYIVANL